MMEVTAAVGGVKRDFLPGKNGRREEDDGCGDAVAAYL